jgi:sigma-B regulation protein RsbU (phosphoserine phosphatase)
LKSLSECTVMVVDDTEENIDILVETLGDDYKISVAMDGEAALEDIAENPPDLILLDIMMPGIDGYEVCRRLKADPETSDIPIIFITAMGELEDEEKGLELGAIDYIRKPIAPTIVKTKVKNQLTAHLAHLTELSKGTATLEKIEKELQVARILQMDILPRSFPERDDIDLFATLKPARQVGGDFYDFFFLNADKLCFVIGDVSGKGVPAALFMSAAKAWIKSTMQADHNPDSILDTVNKELAEDNDTCTFVTVFLGILDLRNGDLSFSNAGHNYPIIFQPGGEPEFLEGGKSMMLGIDDETIYTSKSIQLEPGQCLCLYTDGITEAFNEADEEFSDERLENFISRTTESPVKELVELLVQEVDSFAGKKPQSDDITVLALQYLPHYSSE